MAQTVSYINNGDINADAISAHSIEEYCEWTDKIYEIQESDYVHGGTHGYDNIPHEQLTNRTLYLKTEINNVQKNINNFISETNINQGIINKQIANLQHLVSSNYEYIINVENTVADNKSETDSAIDFIRQTIINVSNELHTHTHSYAASDTVNGAACKVKIYNDDKLKKYITAVNDDGLIYSLPLYIENDTLYVNRIKGSNLEIEGNARTASGLNKNIDIYFYGDVVGNCRTNFNVSTLKINTTLEKQGKLKSGTYGPNNDASDVQLQSKDKFVVPQITVNDRGIITNAKSYVFNLPRDLISGTTNSTQCEENTKLYLVGAENQDETEHTYSYHNAYVLNGRVFSNGNETVNTLDRQNLLNKTYNGYVLNAACAYGVESNIQGVDGENNKLVTSHALFNHKHEGYALGNSDGCASKVAINNAENINNAFLTFNKNDKIYSNIKFRLSEDTMQCENVNIDTLTISNALNIPGGSIWIESDVGNDEEIEIVPAVQKSYDGFARTVKVDFECSSGTLLAYTDKYVLADNTSESTCCNLVLTVNNSLNGKVGVINFGTYILDSGINNGKECFVGKRGNVLFEVPVSNNIKKIGYAEGNTLIFMPF